jgi:hypothetical protein
VNTITPAETVVMPEIAPVTAPSGFRIEQAVSVWQSARARLLADDAELAHDEAALAELLGDETGDVRTILSRLLQATHHANAMADGAAEMLASLRGRQDRYRRRCEAYRATLFAIMDATGKKKEEFPHGIISIRAGKSSLIITDETKLEERFIVTTVTKSPDKAAIRTAIGDGEVIEGAQLSNGLPILTIRGK